MDKKFTKEQLEKIREELMKRVQVLYSVLMDYQMQLQNIDSQLNPTVKVEEKKQPTESKNK